MLESEVIDLVQIFKKGKADHEIGVGQNGLVGVGLEVEELINLLVERDNIGKILDLHIGLPLKAFLLLEIFIVDLPSDIEEFIGIFSIDLTDVELVEHHKTDQVEECLGLKAFRSLGT